ncbi:MAG: hypothetical protein HY514_00775 [Candidatus Aenigmarchaeota archaeon]|nr:hypothetical protein [Candidatus Aenigmarchaeota archaeon]
MGDEAVIPEQPKADAAGEWKSLKGYQVLPPITLEVEEWFVRFEEVSPLTCITGDEIVRNGRIDHAQFLKLVGAGEKFFDILRYLIDKAVASSINGKEDPVPRLWKAYSAEDKNNYHLLKEYEKVSTMFAQLLGRYNKFQSFEAFISRPSIMIVGDPERCKECSRQETDLGEMQDKIPYPVGILDLGIPLINDHFKKTHKKELAEGGPQSFFYVPGRAPRRVVGYLGEDRMLTEMDRAQHAVEAPPKYFAATS